MAAYLTIAFGVAWAPFVPCLLGGHPTGVALMPFAPAVACLVTRRWVTREGLADLGLRTRSWRGGHRSLATVAIAVLWPFPATALAGLLAGQPWLAVGWIPAAQWVGLSVAVAPLILGEELGWRGHLQTRVCPGHRVGAAVVTGALWGVWHYPLLLTTPRASFSLLLGFTAGTVTMSVFLGWLRERTGSVWTPSLGHASNNVTEDNLHEHVLVPSAGSTTTTSLVAEAVVLLGVVGLDRWHARREVVRDDRGPSRPTVARIKRPSQPAK